MYKIYGTIDFHKKSKAFARHPDIIFFKRLTCRVCSKRMLVAYFKLWKRVDWICILLIDIFQI